MCNNAQKNIYVVQTLYIEFVLSVDTTQHEDKCIIFIILNLNYYNVMC
jgi:hypothetical protein